MKKFCFIAILAVLVLPVFAQTADITEYFPVEVGSSWTYANSSGKNTEVVFVCNSMPDKKDGTMLYLFEHQLVGMGSTSTMYSIKDNKVVILVTKNIRGSYQENQPPYPVELALAGQEWRYNDRGDDLRLKTSKASCNFDNKVYNDCILVEERIVDDNKTLRTKKSYFAKGIGLVYVTLQSAGEQEKVFMKLVDTNIKTGATQSVQEKDVAMERLSKISAVFFSGLAQGVKTFPYTATTIVQNLNDENEKELFAALIETMLNDLNILYDMGRRQRLQAKTFANTPTLDRLISSSGNKYIAIGFDRAIKVIVLSWFLRDIYESGNRNIENKDLVSGTKIAEPIIKAYFIQDPPLGILENEMIDTIYSGMIGIYLNSGGK